ncbi:MAG: ABC transporter ATP-binding protein [Thermoproteota archaeon]
MSGEDFILSVVNLSKKYGDVIALQDVTFSIRKRELVTVLGPSGSGKSTLLMSIAGFVKPDGGSIYINGLKVNDVPPYKRNVGVVFQSLALFPHMTVYENIAFPLKIRKLPKDEVRNKVKKILEVVKLSGFEDRRIDQLSGGQKQRVALARTLVFEPSVLLLDEPLGALDRKLREEMQVEIKRIHNAVGATTLFVTHDQYEAMRIADRLIVMKDGRIEQIGKPEEVYGNPKTLFVAEFLGETNMIKGVAKREQEKTLFKSEHGLIFQLPENVEGQGYIAIRSEDLNLYESREEIGNLPVNHVKIINRFFEGDHILYEVDFNGMMLKVRDIEGNRVFKLGQEAYLTCNPDRIKIFLH